MPMMIWSDRRLRPTTEQCPPAPYRPVKIGKPLGVKLLTLFPGPPQFLGGSGNLMITSQTRVGPSNEPAPRLVNLLIYGHKFKDPTPIQTVGGNIYGDLMLYYTKACAGQWIGFSAQGS